MSTHIVNFVNLETGEVFRSAAVRGEWMHPVDLPVSGLSSHPTSGSAVKVGVSVHDAAPAFQLGGRLIDATWWVRNEHLVVVPRCWDFSYVPTTRTLSEIMEDAVSHGQRFPTHGTNCSCMDELAREIRIHLSKAMPPDTMPHDSDMSQDDIRRRLDGRRRIAHLMNMSSRTL